MVELVGVHRADDGQLVGDGGEIRQQFGHFDARLAVFGELVRRAEHLRHALDEREPLLLEERFGAGLAVQLLQLRLVVEQFELRRRAGHVQVDDVLGLGGEVRRLGGERIDRPFAPIARAEQPVRPASAASATPPRPTPL